MRATTLGLALAFSLAPATTFAQPPAHHPEMIVLFTIKDYDAWRPVFDAAAPERAKAGISSAQIYRSVDTPNALLVVFDVTSEKSGRTWMSSSQVRAAWTKGGVIGTPSYRFAR